MSPWFTTLPFFHLWDFTPKESWHTLRFEKDTRYYSIHLKKDLLDDWIIVVINGRIQTKLGQVRTLAFPCFTDAFTEVCDMIEVRLKRGYRFKSWQSNNPLLLQFIPFAPIKPNPATQKKQNTPRQLKSKQPTTHFQPQPSIKNNPQQMGFVF